MIHMTNQTKKPYQCEPCQKKGNITPAQFWCKANQSLFCESCKVDFHDMIHTKCDPVDISKSSRFDLRRQETSSSRCGKHQKKNHYYCGYHKFLGCSKCMVVDHRSCADVSTIEDFYGKLEKSHSLDENRNGVQQALDSMNIMIQDVHLRMQSISDDKDTAFKCIDDLEERMIKCIAKMKREITDELVSAFKKEQEQLIKISQKCQRLKVSMHNTLESSAAAQHQKDVVNTILLYQRGQAEVESSKALIKELIKSFSTIKIGNEVDSKNSNISASLSLGKIVVQKEERNVPEGLDTYIKPFAGRKMKEIRKTNIECSSDCYGCCLLGIVILPDGRIIASDFYNQKLKLINSDGNVVNVLKINAKPRGLCMVDNNTVAAAVESPGGVRVVTVAPSALILSQEINTQETCYSIACIKGELVVSTASVIRNVTKNDTYKLRVNSNRLHGMSYDSQHGQLFLAHYTDATRKMAITRFGVDDNTHTDVLEVGVVKHPFGVDLDKEGNVYVSGGSSDNVIQMSRDGKNVRELLTAADGMSGLRAISVCGDKVVVTNLLHDQQDYIRLFQLV